MTEKEITELQKKAGVYETQININTGIIWGFEGSVGRAAMQMLEDGICMLSKESTHDYWGNRLPSRDEVEQGTKGSLENCIKYWSNYEEEEINNDY